MADNCIYAMIDLVAIIGMVKFVTLLHRNGKVRNQHSVYIRTLSVINSIVPT